MMLNVNDYSDCAMSGAIMTNPFNLSPNIFNRLIYRHFFDEAWGVEVAARSERNKAYELLS